MGAADSPNKDTGKPTNKWAPLLIGACALPLLVSGIWGVTSSLQPASNDRRVTATLTPLGGYVGSQSCATCHPGEAAAHSRSGHARTLRPAGRSKLAERLDGVSCADPEDASVTWVFAFREGKLVAERRAAGRIERLPIDYTFGSGHHATTFVTLTDRSPDHPAILEHRMTAFAHKELPDITPGQARDGDRKGIVPEGRRYGPDDALKCFGCHTTVTSSRGAIALEEATMIPNVGCERCHGPAGKHVELARKGIEGDALKMPFGTERSMVDEQLRLCGSCHRLPEFAERDQIRPENPVLARFQPIGLMQSACYTKSGKSLSCVTCHEPHSRTSTNAAGYEAVCLSCHDGVGRTPCKLPKKADCVSCHMPKRDVSRGMMMTDHWIRSQAAGLGTRVEH
jgi:hypothetical protein